MGHNRRIFPGPPPGGWTLLRHGVAVAALLAGATAAGAQPLRYQATATPVDYRRSQTDQVIQIVNGQEQRTDIESFWRFSASVIREGDGVEVRIVHDSLSLTSVPAPLEPLDFSSVVGEPILVRMSERGQVLEVVLPEVLPPVAERLDLRSTYRTFFPVLPGAPVDEGDAWADTVAVRHEQNGVDIAVTRVNHYSVAGEEEVSGRRAVRIDYRADFSLEGRGAQQAAEIALSGTGDGTGTFWVEPAAGLYLGGRERSEMRMEAFVAAPGGQNLLIPIVQQRTETVELVPPDR